MTRCKVGDMCYYIGNEVPHAKWQIVQCMEFVPSHYGPAWIVDPPIRGALPEPWRDPRFIADRVLQPIRPIDPGAADQLLRPLPETVEG